MALLLLVGYMGEGRSDGRNEGTQPVASRSAESVAPAATGTVLVVPGVAGSIGGELHEPGRLAVPAVRSGDGVAPSVTDHGRLPTIQEEVIDVPPPAAPEPVLQAVPDAASVRAWAVRTFPEDPNTALRILYCESKDGQHPRTYALNAGSAGPMQINRATWERFFREKYGWSWAQVVSDLDTHFRAAREIYDRAGGTWFPWSCRP